MNRLLIAAPLIIVLALGSITVAHAAPKPEAFVVNLFQRFAYRDPSPQEVTYWAARILDMTPANAEEHLKNWFFVHAAYKTTLDRTVTIFEVKDLVSLLDKGDITYQAIQWSLFTSPEYKKIKAQGRAGKNFMKYSPSPL